MRVRLARCRPALLVLLVALAVFAASARAEPAQNRRVALVIGNGAYENVGRLTNPGNDARLIAETLRGLGFALVGDGAQLDLDKPEMDRIVQRFGQAIIGADVALLYYSGHGLQVQGSNWLVPIDANPTRPQDLDFQMVNADVVLHQMEGAGTRLNVLILDACRNNPFGGRGLRATAGGLAEMRAPEGTLISYATQPGNVAQDGEGANSPFATALAAAMPRPNLDIFRMFNHVGVAVKRATGGAQQPWVSNSPIEGDFYFAAPASPSEPVSAAAEPLVLPAQPAPAHPAPAVARSSWRPFRPPGGGFVVLLPGEPIDEPTADPHGAGAHRFVLATSGGHYQVEYRDIAAGRSPDPVLDDFQRVLLNVLHATIRDSRIVAVSGFPGRELRFEMPGPASGRMRMCVVNNRLYYFWYAGGRGFELRPEVDRFLDSFEFVGG